MDNPIQDLKAIVKNQKTISTSRLGPILKDIEKMYIEQGAVIRKQNKQLKEVKDELNGIKGGKLWRKLHKTKNIKNI